MYDLRSGTSKYEVGWISRASADQRAGRAGRTGPGHAYRLYSSAVYGSLMPPFEDPEVVRTPADTLVLSLKALGIPCVSSFPLPTPPPPAALHAAIRSLSALGALVPRLKAGASSSSSASATAAAAGKDGAAADASAAAQQSLSRIDSEQLTPLGSQLARLPLAPHLGKMLVLAAASSSSNSNSASLLDYAIALVACLAAGDPFFTPTGSLMSGGGGKGKSSNGTNNSTAKDSAAVAAVEGGDEQNEADKEEKEEGGNDDSRYKRLVAELQQEEQEAEEENDENGGSDEEGESSEKKKKKAAATSARHAAAAAHASFRHPLSDALTLLRAAGAYAHTLASGGAKAASAFARANYLREKALREGLQLRRQLHTLVHSTHGLVTSSSPPSASTAASGGGNQEGDEEDTPEDMEALTSAGDADAAEEGDVASGEPDSAASSKQKRRRRGASGRVPVPPFPLSLPPPSPATETSLRPLLAAGLLERVAKRAPADEVPALLQAGGISTAAASRKRWAPYLPSSGALSAPFFLHPRSTVADSDASLCPPYVVFTEVVSTDKRQYMRCATAIEPSWLHSLAAGTPLIRWEPPLEHPPPLYDVSSDSIQAPAIPVFGDRAWRLSPARIPFPIPPGSDPASPSCAAADARLRVFARALIEGKVAPAFAQWTGFLASQPSALTKRSPQQRCALLLEVLRRPPGEFATLKTAGDGIACAPVDSAAKLAAVWARYPAYLLAEYRQWLQSSVQDELNRLWPQAVAASLQQWGASAAGGGGGGGGLARR